MVKGTSSGQGGAGNLQEGKGKDEERGAKLLEGINGSKVAEKTRYSACSFGWLLVAGADLF
jgi:hypothetical protein